MYTVEGFTQTAATVFFGFISIYYLDKRLPYTVKDLQRLQLRFSSLSIYILWICGRVRKDDS
jgi:hypothetical protein